jgi:hypothetical protein
VLHPHEEELDLGSSSREGRDGADEGDGIEPVVDAPAPDDEFVVDTDARQDPLEDGTFVLGRCRREAEGNDTDEAAQLGVARVRPSIDAARTGELTQPEEPLTLRGADEVVTELELRPCSSCSRCRGS